MRFDLIDLRLFLRIVEAGSITGGAARASLSLAAASERLGAMEAAGGTRLLDRGRRGIAPTAAGEALAHHARLILRQVEQMQGELGAYARGFRGNVRLLANTAAVAEHLPDALSSYLATRPSLDIDVHERLSTEIVKAVAGGLAEVGIISDAVDPGGLLLLPFATDRIVAVMAAGHPLATARRLAFADLLGEDFIGLTAGSPLQDHIDEHAARAGRPLRFRLRVRTFDGICRAAAHGIGLGLIPETAARRHARAPKLRTIRLTDPWATRQLSLCVQSLATLSPLARDLVAHLSQLPGAHRGQGANA